MKKQSKSQKRQQARRQAARTKQRVAAQKDESPKNDPLEAASNRAGVSLAAMRAFMFWFSGFGFAVTLIGNYNHFLTATSWVRWIVDSWGILLDNFWILFWKAIGFHPPAWLRAFSSLLVFLNVYLSGIGIPKSAKKNYNSATDYISVWSFGSQQLQARMSTYISDFYIYTGLKYIVIGFMFSAGLYENTFESFSFLMISILIILFIMLSPARKIWYREKLALRMMYILFSAAFLFGTSQVPFMQFDPSKIPAPVERSE